jgi:hypothetical protein
MDIILDYRKDRNNGISTITSLDLQQLGDYGEPVMTNQYMLVPIKLSGTHFWKIYSYKYNSDVDNWVSHQLLDDEFDSAGGPIRTAMSFTTTFTSPLTMCILNNENSKCYIYRLDEFLRWYLMQTLDIPTYAGTNYYSKRVALDSDYLAISDWKYGNGILCIYMYNGVTGLYELQKTITSPTSNTRFGIALHMRGTMIAVGDPYVQTVFPKDGKVYIYEGAVSTWVLTGFLIGAAGLNAYFGQSLQLYSSGGTTRLLVGAPGMNNARGTAYFYHRSGIIWSLNTTMTAPLIYQADDNQFGSYVSIWEDQAAISAGNELLGQGAVYVHKYSGGVWSIDTLSDGVNPARFTHTGIPSYGVYICQTPQTVFTFNQGNNAYFLSRRPLGYTEFTFIYHTDLYVKKTKDESFFHLASGNQTITFKLETPIQGKYKIQLNMANNIQTVGPHNDTLYFSIDGGYYSAKIEHGNYTGADLATHIMTRLLDIYPTALFFVRYNAGPQKFEVITIMPFAFGSNDNASFRNSAQDKLMGMYNNDYYMIHGIYASDRRTTLATPTRIGVLLREGVPETPVRNNSIFAEIGLLAELDVSDNRFKITTDMNNIFIIPQKTRELTFSFPCIDGGQPLDINTNDIYVRLTKTD